MLITTKSGTIEIAEDESLLDALEKNGYVIEYQCRSGYCGSCRLKLKKGRVEYDSPPLAFLFPEEILPCCCTVKEDLYIEISHPSSMGSSYQKDFFDFEDLFDEPTSQEALDETKKHK
ncbi:MAG: class I ribonucleotide reductase maintenance protein YfaE [Neisseriaceae bacterium]|nr:2Fe-2S ferredoxin-like protein [Neisseriaceae bacterium PsAf]MCV2503086.1 class I ribonucleotide reductase maintenance protein YfaE [Neisseriaceae bacterium]MCV2509299.1 class I ribonucleotide reductase maintenance protein YfaE [Neisseriaceae bacterium]